MSIKGFSAHVEYSGPQPASRNEIAIRHNGRVAGVVGESPVRATRAPPTPSLAAAPQSTPQSRLGLNWLQPPAILERLSTVARHSSNASTTSLSQPPASQRAEIIGRVRQALIVNAPYLTIVQVVAFTTEITSQLMDVWKNKPFVSEKDMKAVNDAVVARLLSENLLYSTLPSSSEASAGLAATVGISAISPSLVVVISKPLFRDDGSVGLYASVRGGDGVTSQWALFKGNRISSEPVDLNLMAKLGGAESLVVEADQDTATLLLEIHPGTLRFETQYTVVLHCANKWSSAEDSLTFVT